MTTARDIIDARGMNFDEESDGQNTPLTEEEQFVETVMTGIAGEIRESMRVRREAEASAGAEAEAEVGVEAGAEAGDQAGAEAGDQAGDQGPADHIQMLQFSADQMAGMMGQAFLRGQQIIERPFIADERDNARRRGTQNFNLSEWCYFNDQHRNAKAAGVSERALAGEIRKNEEWEEKYPQNPTGLPNTSSWYRIPDEAVLEYIQDDAELADLALFFSFRRDSNEELHFAANAQGSRNYDPSVSGNTGGRAINEAATPVQRRIGEMIPYLYDFGMVMDAIRVIRLADGEVEFPRFTQGYDGSRSPALIAEGRGPAYHAVTTDAVTFRPFGRGVGMQVTDDLNVNSPRFRGELMRNLLMGFQTYLQQFIFGQIKAGIPAAQQVDYDGKLFGTGLGSGEVADGRLWRAAVNLDVTLDTLKLPMAGRVMYITPNVKKAGLSYAWHPSGYGRPQMMGNDLANMMVRYTNMLTNNEFLEFIGRMFWLARWGGLFRLVDPLSDHGNTKYDIKVYIDTDDMYAAIGSFQKAS